MWGKAQREKTPVELRPNATSGLWDFIYSVTWGLLGRGRGLMKHSRSNGLALHCRTQRSPWAQVLLCAGQVSVTVAGEIGKLEVIKSQRFVRHKLIQNRLTSI